MLDPFSGPGTLKEARQQQRREQFKIAVWAIIWANVVLFGGLLIQGCQREPATAETSGDSTAEVASSDTNGMMAAPAKPETNTPVAAAPEATPANPLPEASPTVAPSPVQAATKPYTVAKGDSFYKIAKANGISVKALLGANLGINSAKLKVGQVLQLPTSAAPSAVVAATPASATASQPAAPTSKAQARYVVKSGDTLDRIARAHRTTVQALKAANGLTSDRIAAGQSLKMPETKMAGSARAHG
jgi:LysM repeat protein